MKILLNYKYLLLLLCIGVFTMSCNDQKDLISDVTPTEELKTPVNQQVDQNTMETIFTYLANQENIKELSINDQFSLIQEFASTQGLNFNLDQAIYTYENNVNRFDNITEEEEFILSEYTHINELIMKHGYTTELTHALEAYKASFIQSTSKLEVDPSSIQTVLSIVDQTNFMVNNAGIQRYLHTIDSDLLVADLNSRGFLGCLAAQISLAIALASCAANPFACAGVPYAIWQVQQQCDPGGGGPPVDPCLNSPNPCCGVHCASGFYCNSSGICVVDPNDTGCINTGCPPGFQCAGNTCIPI